MTAYSKDSDLIKIRPNVLDLGVPNWLEKHDDAKSIINRAIDKDWYRSIALDNNVDFITIPFDSDLLLNSNIQLNRLSCYKTLELIYLNLQKDTPEDDGFERQRKIFKDLYHDEFEETINSGLDYDWDASGVVAPEEKMQTRKRRLRRA